MLKGFVLFAGRFDDMGVAMADADGDDAAEAVQVTSARVVPYVLHFAFDEHQRLFVVEEDAWVDELLAQGQHLVGGRSTVGFGFVIGGGQSGRLHGSSKKLSVERVMS